MLLFGSCEVLSLHVIFTKFGFGFVSSSTAAQASSVTLDKFNSLSVDTKGGWFAEFVGFGKTVVVPENKSKIPLT